MGHFSVEIMRLPGQLSVEINIPWIEPAAGRTRRMMIMAVMGMMVVPAIQILAEGIAADIDAAVSRSGHGEPGGRVDGDALVR